LPELKFQILIFNRNWK